MRGPREDRVTLFEKSLQSLLRNKPSNELHSAFVCGYLASQIGPGAIDHVSLLAPCVHTMPTTFLWYGLCAGLQQNSKLPSYAEGLGRRVLRDALHNENFLDRPSGDIALSELDVVTRSEGPAMEFHTGTKGHLEVELAPCVYSIVRWPSREEFTANRYSTMLETAEVRDVLVEMDRALDRVDYLRSRLSRLVGGFEGTSRDKRDQRDRKR
jgi:hypothetical protein